MPSKLSKFDSLDTLKNADMTQQETAEDLMYGVAETGNLEKAAELFQVRELSAYSIKNFWPKMKQLLD